MLCKRGAGLTWTHHVDELDLPIAAVVRAILVASECVEHQPVGQCGRGPNAYLGMGAAQNGERGEEEQPLHLMYLQTNASV